MKLLLLALLAALCISCNSSNDDTLDGDRDGDFKLDIESDREADELTEDDSSTPEDGDLDRELADDEDNSIDGDLPADGDQESDEYSDFDRMDSDSDCESVSDGDLDSDSDYENESDGDNEIVEQDVFDADEELEIIESNENENNTEDDSFEGNESTEEESEDCPYPCSVIGEEQCNYWEFAAMWTCERISDTCTTWVKQHECLNGFCPDVSYCVTCNNECIGSWHRCNVDNLENCIYEYYYDCHNFEVTECELGCEDGRCLKNICGNETLEDKEVCDSSTILCSDICSDYADEIATCNDQCTAFDTSTCTPPVVERRFVPISAGSFTMGFSLDMMATPHQVSLSRDIYVMNTKVTQADYESLMGSNPSEFSACGPTCPVESVTYFDALHYANNLSQQEGLTPCYIFDSITCGNDETVEAEADCLTRGGISNAVITLNQVASAYDCEGYRLPTEAEWEYVARAGTTTYAYNGNITIYDDVLDPVLDLSAWYLMNSHVEYEDAVECSILGGPSGIYCGTKPIALKQPNGNCIYDILGNTREWVYDKFNPDIHLYSGNDPETSPAGIDFSEGSENYGIAFRGCFWGSSAEACILGRRCYRQPANKANHVGFRLVRTINDGI